MFKTKNYGETWTKIVNGIPNNFFTRVLGDPEEKDSFTVEQNQVSLFLLMMDYL